jgi:hypothetical protein
LSKNIITPPLTMHTTPRPPPSQRPGSSTAQGQPLPACQQSLIRNAQTHSAPGRRNVRTVVPRSGAGLGDSL